MDIRVLRGPSVLRTIWQIKFCRDTLRTTNIFFTYEIFMSFIYTFLNIFSFTNIEGTYVWKSKNKTPARIYEKYRGVKILFGRRENAVIKCHVLTKGCIKAYQLFAKSLNHCVGFKISKNLNWNSTPNKILVLTLF